MSTRVIPPDAARTMRTPGMPEGLDDCVRESGLMVWYQPDTTRSELWSPGPFLSALGYAPGEVAPTTEEYFARVHPDDLERVVRRVSGLRNVTQSGTFEADYRLRRADGQFVWVRATVAVSPASPGRPPSAFVYSRAIPEEQRLERARPGPHADALHTVMNEIGHPVVLMSPVGVVVGANEAMARAVQLPLEALVGHRCPFLHANATPVSAQQAFRDATATGARQRMELHRFDAWWDLHLVPIRNASGVVDQVLLLAADVTERKAQERERLASERALTLTLVREVHHRIKNHLQGLVGLLRLNQRQGLGADEVIERAILQVHSIATVHGLLARHSGEGVDLNVIVRETLRLVEQDRPQGMRFEAHLEKAVTADIQPEDAVAVALVIGELIMNAAKHTQVSPDAFVEIRLRGVDADTMEVTVRNAPADLPEGFTLESRQGSRGGLDLVQRLLPRGSTLTLGCEAGSVAARLTLRRGRPAA